MPRAAKNGRYHHGDLPAALIDTAIELIGQRGLAGFSLAEASRRLGVTVAAPYKHFADRDDLLAAVAVRALDAFVTAVGAERVAGSDPADQMAALARGHIRFAVGHRSLFQVLFTAGLDKHKHPNLERAIQGIAAEVYPSALALGDGDRKEAEELALAVVAIAHGYAMLLLSGTFGPVDDAVEETVARASRAAHDLVRGRLIGS